MNKLEKYFYIVAFILLFFSLYHNLGLQPLFQEEPRRAMIALEMQYNENIIVPTEFGEFYYKKPPLWNWVLLTSFKLFGEASEFAVRFFTVLSHIIIGLSIIWIFKKHASLHHGIIGAFLYWVSIDIFYYFSMLGEIDIFYSMLTFLSFIFLFHFYSIRKYFFAFALFYSLNGLGFLTKGFPSIAFAGFTVTVLLLLNRDLKRLFSWRHISGGMFFLIIIGTYFLLYARETQNDSFLTILWGRSAQRTILQESSPHLIKHLSRFPYKTFIGLIPASLLLVFSFSRKKFIEHQKQLLFKFMFWAFIANYIVYLVSPGALQRYIYMLYPMFCIFTAFFIHEAKPWQGKLLNILFKATPVIFLSATTILFACNFFPSLPHAKQAIGICAILFLALSILTFKFDKIRIPVFFLSFIVFRILFNETVLPLRDKDSEAQVNKENGLKIASITRENPLFIYDKDICSRNSAFYIERETKQPLKISNNLIPGNYYILVKDRHFLDGNYEELLTFNEGHSKKEFQLIKITGNIFHIELYKRELAND